MKIRELKDGARALDSREAMTRILIERDVLRRRVDCVNQDVDVYVVYNNDIDKYVSKMEHFIDEFHNLVGKFRLSKVDMKPAELLEIEGDLMQSVEEIQLDVKLARLLKRKFREVQDNLSQAKTVAVQQTHSIASAENLKSEISYRFKSLSKHFDADLQDLGDYQVLEIHQDKKNVDLEFSSVMEKVSELSSLVSTGGDKVEQLYLRACKTRDRLSQKREDFFAKLQEIILERDITADKMKSALDVAIEVPKFSGYDGKIDIYTFKSEFKKLVEPRVQKKYYADYLKRNYLSGPASVLVEKETDYEKIWERLLSSYGNARLLLQNKLSTLDKLSLTSVRGDQKISVTLASLINTMRDLSTLAAEHNIEGQLYEGGGPEKVLFLIGESRHRKFRSQNLGPAYTKKQEWQKLEEFLQTDLKLREKLSLDHKTAEQLGLTTGKENPSKAKPGSHNATVGQQCSVTFVISKDTQS